MRRISATLRITVGLAFIATFVVLTAHSLGLDGNVTAKVLEGRSRLCESVALFCSAAVAEGRTASLPSELSILVDRNAELLAIRLAKDGEVLANVEPSDEATHRVTLRADQTPMVVGVPIFAGNQQWGTVELVFTPLEPGNWRDVVSSPIFLKVSFTLAASAFAFYLYLRKVLSHLDPSRVIPSRVRAALDTLAEGLLVIDNRERIVLANRAFSQQVGWSTEQIQGRRVDELPWKTSGETPDEFPWTQTLRDGEARLGVLIEFEQQQGVRRTYLVNSSPVVSEDGKRHGILASFDDVTVQERRKDQLKRALLVLEKSREQIRHQNEELLLLATRDPLTGAFNRRSFFEQTTPIWQQSRQQGQPLCCMMVDIDHFKSINDRFGHSEGDRVLREVAKVLLAEESAMVCRYGGEEFCLLVPDVDLDRTVALGDHIRQQLTHIKVGDSYVTASLGAAERTAEMSEFQQLIELADQCLYTAKRSGRDRVVSSRQPQVMEAEVPHTAPEKPATPDVPVVPVATTNNEDTESLIPFPAVTALISALSYRDSATAEHSRRVADLCVELGRRRMTLRDVYVLETAALLHDIGKIGVPDAILLKAGPLSNSEWQVMKLHDRMGVEMVKASFSCPELWRIIDLHHAPYGGSGDPRYPVGDEIPLSARILTIVDAYDAMVSDRVYRPGMASDMAFAELRRCAGKQFDPALVEEFIKLVRDRQKNTLTGSLGVSKQTALRIGLQIERLTDALEQQDLGKLNSLAKRLEMTAREVRLDFIAERAKSLAEAAHEDAELASLVETAVELVDLCRATQYAYLELSDGPRPRDTVPAERVVGAP